MKRILVNFAFLVCTSTIFTTMCYGIDNNELIEKFQSALSFPSQHNAMVNVFSPLGELPSIPNSSSSSGSGAGVANIPPHFPTLQSAAINQGEFRSIGGAFGSSADHSERGTGTKRKGNDPSLVNSSSPAAAASSVQTPASPAAIPSASAGSNSGSDEQGPSKRQRTSKK